MKRLLLPMMAAVLLLSACTRSRKGTEGPVQPAVDTVQAAVDTVPVAPPAPKAYAPSVRKWLSVRASGRMEVPGAGGL